MNPDQRDRILAACDEASIEISGFSIATSAATVSKWLRGLAEMTEQLKTREQIIELLSKLRDLSPEEELMALEACHYAPELFRLGGIALADLAKKEFPRAPGGGRPPVLTSEAKGQVCRFIGELIPNTSLKAAILRASQRFAVSERTIRSAWSQRLQPRELSAKPKFSKVAAAVKKLFDGDT